MKCDIPSINAKETYDSLKTAMNTQNYWVKFFMRPCCPPPGESVARNLIDHLKSDLNEHPTLTDSEKAELCDIADDRLTWYLGLSVRRGG